MLYRRPLRPVRAVALLVIVLACSAGRHSEREPEVQTRASEPQPATGSAPASAPFRVYAWANPVPSDCGTDSLASSAGGAPSVPFAQHNRGSGVVADAGTTPSARGNVGNAARVVAAMRPRFRACYQALLDQRNHNAAGRVRLRIDIDCKGRIRAMGAEASGVDQAMVECMFAVASRDRFDPPIGGSAVVRVPATFVRQPRSSAPDATTPDAG
jgi:hypothetical protein